MNDRKGRVPELLAPAGSFASLKAAVAAGADAVYLGSVHNARAYAENFTAETLPQAIDYAHLHGVSVYVTLNTLTFDKEREEILRYADSLVEMGADGAIVADTGLLSLLGERVPSLPLHLSTQAFVHDRESAALFSRLGVKRVVLARELPLEEIRAITKDNPMEFEVFLHGALCVSYSGQCLFSSLVGGRSGNRGECAQPCRLPYTPLLGDRETPASGPCPLSLKDLALCDRIPALLSSGIASLKIEGRMKSPHYVYGVTSIYRRLLDEGRGASTEEKATLSALFCRGGFTDGYLTGKSHLPMTGVRREEDKERSRTAEREALPEAKLPLSGSARIVEGEPVTLTLSRLSPAIGYPSSVTVTGEVPERAQSRPVGREEILSRLLALGTTPFFSKEEAFTLTLGEGLFLPERKLKELRRRAVCALMTPLPAETRESAPPKARTLLESAPPHDPSPALTALCYRSDQVAPVLESGLFGAVFFPLMHHSFLSLPVNGAYLPPVIWEGQWGEVKKTLQKAIEIKQKTDTPLRYALVSTPSQAAYVASLGLTPIGDFRLNVTSTASARALGLSDVILSPELTLPRIRDIARSLPAGGVRVITYGRLPLMLTERCFRRENGGCEGCAPREKGGNAPLSPLPLTDGERPFSLCDRLGVRFPLLREYPHRSLILNSLPTYMEDKREALRSSGITHRHMIFTVEGSKECRALLSSLSEGAPLPFRVRRIP